MTEESSGWDVLNSLMMNMQIEMKIKNYSKGLLLLNCLNWDK
jgi:hypothetical protein